MFWKPRDALRVPSALELEASFPKPVFNLDPNLCLAPMPWGEPVPHPGKPADTDILPRAVQAASNPLVPGGVQMAH